MKVLHIIPRMVPSPNGVFVGGSVNALFNITQITSHYFKSLIYTHTDHGSKKFFHELRLKDLDTYVEENTMPPSSMLYGLYFIIRGLYTLIKNKAWDADVLHGHSGFPFYGLLTVLAGKILKKHTIHSLYCPVSNNKRKYFSGFINMKLSYFSLIFADKILAMSKNVKTSLLKIAIPQEKIEVFQPFIDTIKFNPQHYSVRVRNEVGAYGEKPIILFIGNLKYSKGLDILVDALGSIAKKVSFRFVFTLELKDKKFESNLQKLLEKIDNNGLSECTTQLDIINYMPSLMASSDLIVFPYRNTDGPSDYPIALMEAMASGIPAIGSKVGGIPELIEDGVTGILVDADNVHKLTLAIQTMIDNPSYRKELGKNARNKILEMFQVWNLSNTITKIYHDLLKIY